MDSPLQNQNLLGDYDVKPKRRKSWFDQPTQSLTFDIPFATQKENSPPEVCDVETLILTSFTSPPKLDFGTVKLGQTKTCQLNFRNPHECEQQVKIQKFPSKKGFSVEELEFEVEASSTLRVYIEWTPTEPGNVRELMMCQAQSPVGVFRVQAYFLGSCPEPPKPKKQRKGIQSLKKPTNAIGRPQTANQTTSGKSNVAAKSRPPLQNANSQSHPSMRKDTAGNRSNNNKPSLPARTTKSHAVPQKSNKPKSCNDRILSAPIETNKENDPRMTVRLSKPTFLLRPEDFVENGKTRINTDDSVYSEESMAVETLMNTYIIGKSSCEVELKTGVFEPTEMKLSPETNVFEFNCNSSTTYMGTNNSVNSTGQPKMESESYNEYIETVEYTEETCEVISHVEEEEIITETVTTIENGVPTTTYSVHSDVNQYSSSVTSTDTYCSTDTGSSQSSKNNGSWFAKNDPNFVESPLRRVTFIKDDPSLPDTPTHRMTFVKDDPSLPDTPTNRMTFIKDDPALPHTPTNRMTFVKDDPALPHTPTNRMTFVKNDPALPHTPTNRMTFVKDDPALPHTPTNRMTFVKNDATLPNGTPGNRVNFIKDDPDLPITPVRRETFYKEECSSSNLPNTPIINSPDSLNTPSAVMSPRSRCRMGMSTLAGSGRKRYNRSVSPPQSRNATPRAQFNDDTQISTKSNSNEIESEQQEEESLLVRYGTYTKLDSSISPQKPPQSQTLGGQLVRHGTYSKLDSSLSPKASVVINTAENSPSGTYSIRSEVIDDLDDLPYTCEDESNRLSTAAAARERKLKKLSIISERSEREKSVISVDSDVDEEDLDDELQRAIDSAVTSKYATAYTTPYESPGLSGGEDEDKFEDSLSYHPNDDTENGLAANTTVLENSQLMASLLRDKLERVVSYDGTPPVITADDGGENQRRKAADESNLADDSVAYLFESVSENSVQAPVPTFEDNRKNLVSDSSSKLIRAVVAPDDQANFSKDQSGQSSHVSIDAMNESVKYHSISRKDKSCSVLTNSMIAESSSPHNVAAGKLGICVVAPSCFWPTPLKSASPPMGIFNDSEVPQTPNIGSSADDSIAHLMAITEKTTVPVFEDVKAEISNNQSNITLPGDYSSRMSILKSHDRSPSIYGINPFDETGVEVSTLGFPNESFLQNEKINLNLYRSAKKNRNRNSSSRMSMGIKVAVNQKSDISQHHILENNLIENEVRQRHSSTPKMKSVHSMDMVNDVSVVYSPSAERVRNETRQRLSSTPKVDASEQKDSDGGNDDVNGRLVRSPVHSPIIGVQKMDDNVLNFETDEANVKKELFSQDGDDDVIEFGNNPQKAQAIDAIIDDIQNCEFDFPNAGHFAATPDEYQQVDNPRRFSTLTVTKTKSSLPLPHISESEEKNKSPRSSVEEKMKSKQLFPGMPSPEERRISTLTITKDKPTVLLNENHYIGNLSKKELFAANAESKLNSVPSENIAKEEDVSTQSTFFIPVDKAEKQKSNSKENLFNKKKAVPDDSNPNSRTNTSLISGNAYNSNKDKKTARRSVAVMQNISDTTKSGVNNKNSVKGKRSSIGGLSVQGKPRLLTNIDENLPLSGEASPQKRDHSVERASGTTRKRFRSEQMKKPPIPATLKRLSVGSDLAKQKNTMPLRKQAALAGMSKSYSVSATAATKRTMTGVSKPASSTSGAVLGLAKSKLKLIKQPKSHSSMPKHPLPFAAKNVYYDERWMDKEEKGFVKWLNFVLTPPDFYFDARKPKKIDAGRVFLDTTQQHNIQMAPTKEVLSFKAYSVNKKFNRLRRSSCKLYQTELFQNVQNKLEREIDCGRLAIRKDRLLFADLGLKRKILDMLLSYNPLWLRLGLETTYGEIINVESSLDIFGVSRFIAQRFLGNPDIAQEFAHASVPHLYRDGYFESLGQFTLKKFLMLVMFLDHAKRSRLIQEDPCLFCKDSDFKSSKEMLLSFSRDFLAGEGDLVKHLGFMGYKVNHSQTALEEVDYAVSNIAVDLRDGIRITRVVSLLTEDYSLLTPLRCPAISRLQKIHNVGVALNALTQRAVDLTNAKGGPIDARDIVDGHREKTLHLLWRIIFNFQVENMIDAKRMKEEIIFLRNNWSTRMQQEAILHDIDPDMLGLPRDCRESVDPSDVYFKSEKLGLLLKWCRAVCAHFGVQVENFTVSFSDGRVLCYLLHYYHPELIAEDDFCTETTQTYMEEKQQDESVNSDDSFSFDNWTPSSNKQSDIFEELLKNENKNFKTLYEKVSELGGIPLMLRASDMSATIPDEKVVVTYVSYLCGRLLDIRLESRAARIIQHAWRVYRVKQSKGSMQERRQAALIIQRGVRRYLTRKHEREQTEAAKVIQCFYRRVQAKKQLVELKKQREMARFSAAAVVIQACVRAFITRKEIELRTSSALKIQTVFRGYSERKYYNKLREAALIVQTRWRAKCLSEEERSKYHRLQKAVTTLQSAVRKWLDDRYKLRNKAATIIQAYYRMYCKRKEYLQLKCMSVRIQSQARRLIARRKYLQLCSSVKTIQLKYRALRMCQKERQQYIVTRKACIRIQSWYRGIKARRVVKKLKAVVKVQSLIKGFVCRMRYAKMKSAAVVLQRRFRAAEQARKERVEFCNVNRCVTKIQACVRGYLVRKTLRKENEAARSIQRFYRACKERSAFVLKKNSTLKIQRFFRGYIEMKKRRKAYLKERESIIKVQSFVRSHQELVRYRTVRASVICIQQFTRKIIAYNRYQLIKKAVIVIQNRFRANQKKKTARAIYKHERESIIKVQSFVRSHQELVRYRKFRASVICIQQFARKMIAYKRYRLIKKAVIVIQNRFRAHQQMKIAQAIYKDERESIIKVQSIVRRHQELVRYRKFRASVICIQQFTRKMIAYNRYQLVKKAVIVIQNRFRANQQMKTARAFYKHERESIIKVQSFVRSHQELVRYRTFRASVICIQQFARKMIAYNRYQLVKKAVIVIQNHFRAHQQMKTARAIYKHDLKCIVTAQSVIRMHQVRSAYNRKRKSVLYLQSLVRRNQKHKEYTRMKAAASVLQKHFQGYLKMKSARENYLSYRKCVIVVQSIARMRQMRKEFKTQQNAVICLQSNIRMVQARKRFLNQKTAVTVIQKYFRGYLLMKSERANYLNQTQCIKTARKVRLSSIVIQNSFRGYLEMKTQREIYLKDRDCIIIAQSVVRMHQERLKFLRMKVAAVRIQCFVRKCLASVKYQQLKQAAVVVQKRVRAYQQMKHERAEFLRLRNSAITLQKFIRMHQTRSEYLKNRDRVIYLQSLVRKKIAVTHYDRVYSAIVCIQRTWRGYSVMKLNQHEFATKQDACITIQSVFRGYMARCKLEIMNRGFAKLQALVKANIQRKRYLDLKEATVKIQVKWRATLLMEQEFERYNVFKVGIVKLQACVRRNLAKQKYQKLRQGVTKLQALARCRIAKKRFSSMRVAAILIQNRFRAHEKRVINRREFVSKKQACVVIQSYLRRSYCRSRYLTMKTGFTKLQALVRGMQARTAKLTLTAAVIVMQYRLRATLLGRKKREEYLSLRKASTTLQSYYRGSRQRSEFLKMKLGFTKLQAVIRAKLAQRKYREMRLSAVKIQQSWRATRVAREDEKRYLILRGSAKIIQSAYRTHKVRKQYLVMINGFVKLQALVRRNLQRKRYMQVRNASSILQKRWRAVLIAREQRKQYKCIIKRVVTLQKVVRGWLSKIRYQKMQRGFTKLQALQRGKVEASRFIKKRNAALTIQRYWRATVCARQTCKRYRAVKIAAVTIQRWFRKCKYERHLRRVQAAITMQTIWRAYKARCVYVELVKRQEMRRYSASVILQHHVRRYILRKRGREDRRRKTECIVKLQSMVRVFLAKRRVRYMRSIMCVQSYVRMFVERRRYLHTCNAVVKCQSVIRTYVLRKRYLMFRNAAQCLQIYRRAQIQGRICRSELAIMHKNARQIQAWYRACNAKRKYLRFRNNVIRIQRAIRGYLYRKHYEKVTKSTVVIQRWWRSLKVVKILRTEYLLKKVSCVTIQRRVKRYLVHKRRFSGAAVTIQKTWRGFVVRRRLAKLERAIVAIQRKFRACRETLLERRKENAVLRIQCVMRMYSQRARFLRTRKSVVKIQTLWRGYKVRKELKDARIQKLRKRIERANNNHTEEKTLAHRTLSALDFLLSCKNLSTVLGALMDLDCVTKLLPECCERLVEANAVHVLYRVILGSNRSIPHQELIKYAVSTLLNLSKYDKTAYAVYNGVDSVSMLVEFMSIYRDKKGCILFPQLCTLLGMVAHVPHVQQEVTQKPKIVEKLQSLYSLVERKHKLEKGRQLKAARIQAMKSFNCTLPLLPPAQKKRAKVKPDWVLKKGCLTHIQDPMDAIEFVLESFQITPK